MFNVLPGTEISEHATVGRTDTMDHASHVQQHGTKKWGVRAYLDPTLPESEGVRTPGPPQDRRHWLSEYQRYSYVISTRTLSADC